MFWTNTLIDVLLFFFVIDCLFMGLVIMMQRSKQEGLGAAFGGGFTESVWGAQTSQVLVKATVWAAIIFFVFEHFPRAALLPACHAPATGLTRPATPEQTRHIRRSTECPDQLCGSTRRPDRDAHDNQPCHPD